MSTRVGYSGGDVPNATCRNHGTHAESIEVVYDPEKTDFRALLEFFFQVHDPSTKNRQGNDIGTSYRSAIFYTTDEQKRVAEDTIDGAVPTDHDGPFIPAGSHRASCAQTTWPSTSSRASATPSFTPRCSCSPARPSAGDG